MAQNSQALDLAEAINRLKATLPQVNQRQNLPLQEAMWRVLAEDLYAPLDMPPFPASAMDGYAVRRRDFAAQPDKAFEVAGTSFAGHPYVGELGTDQTVRIFTGAVVPGGADLVVLQEEVANLIEASDTTASQVVFNNHSPAESYVRPIGHDVNKNAQIGAQGQRITPFLLGALTSYGVNAVKIYAPLRVGVFSTGDELVDATTAVDDLQTGQIYDSNRATVLALLDDPVFETVDLGRINDDQAQTRQFLSEASRNVDVLITSGGVSVGDADYITQTIAELGELQMWRLNLKPGKPMAVGSIGACTIFGLPGNPVSTVVTLLMVAKPLMMEMLHCRTATTAKFSAKLVSKLAHTPGRTEFQRGTLLNTAEGLQVAHTGDQSSNRLNSFAAANCLIEIDKSLGDLDVGAQVTVIPFWGLVNLG